MIDEANALIRANALREITCTDVCVCVLYVCVLCMYVCDVCVFVCVCVCVCVCVGVQHDVGGRCAS